MNTRLGVTILLLYVGMLAISCRAPAASVDCAELSPTPLRDYLGNAVPPLPELSTEIKSANATENLRYVPSTIANSTQQPFRFLVGWDVENRSYTISVGNGINIRSQVMYGRHSPSLSALLACLGAPQEYWAWYGETSVGSGWATYVMLIYPDQGITVWGADYTKRQLSDSGNLQDRAALSLVPVESIVYTLPASSETLVARAWSFEELETPTALRHWYLDHLKPWPGGWEAIDVLREPRP